MMNNSRPRPYQVTVVDVIEETHDAKSLIIEPAASDAEVFSYAPGQYLTLRIPSDHTGFVARCYSLASSPYDDNQLKITIKRTQAGYGSNWICDNVEPGMSIEVLPPNGSFTPHSLDNDLLLVAAGSGVTPIMSILRSALLRGSGHVAMLYANRDESSVIFAKEIDSLLHEYGDRLSVTHWLESRQGLPTEGGLVTFAQQSGAQTAFICGPSPFMRAAKSAFAAAGLAAGRIHVEVFQSLSGDPFTEEVPLTVAKDAKTVHAVVDLDDGEHEIEWPVDVRLLDYLISLGLDVPYMCREGECGTCQATCLSGQIRMVDSSLLDASDLAEGYVLACQSLPDGDDDIHIVF